MWICRGQRSPCGCTDHTVTAEKHTDPWSISSEIGLRYFRRDNCFISCAEISLFVNLPYSSVFVSLHRRGSGWRPSWPSAPSTTKVRAWGWTPWAQDSWVSLGVWVTAQGGGRPWRIFWEEPRRRRPPSAWRRDRGRATRRTWRRNAAAPRAPIRRWGPLLPPAECQRSTMESHRSEGMLLSQHILSLYMLLRRCRGCCICMALLEPAFLLLQLQNSAKQLAAVIIRTCSVFRWSVYYSYR